MGLQHIAPIIEADYRKAVMEATWGHLAPEKDRTYQGRITYAVGCFGCDPLNPTALVCGLEDLDSSPWFFDALNDWLSDLPERFRQPGCVYAWEGSFRNYRFQGKIRRLLDTN